jgi:hypothetical protein
MDRTIRACCIVITMLLQFHTVLGIRDDDGDDDEE